MFKLLDLGGETGSQAWDLINRLPTSPAIFQSIVKLEGVRGAEEANWNLILDQKSPHKLLYTLYIIEYLMSNQDEENKEFNNYLTGSDSSIIENIGSLRSDFIILGGFDHLIKIFQDYKTLDYADYSYFNKLILGFILELIKKFVMASFSTQMEGIHRHVQLGTQVGLNLNFVSSSLQKIEEEASPTGKIGDQAEARSGRQGIRRGRSRRQRRRERLSRREARHPER